MRELANGSERGNIIDRLKERARSVSFQGSNTMKRNTIVTHQMKSNELSEAVQLLADNGF